jgi:hypothetical protein
LQFSIFNFKNFIKRRALERSGIKIGECGPPQYVKMNNENTKAANSHSLSLTKGYPFNSPWLKVVKALLPVLHAAALAI